MSASFVCVATTTGGLKAPPSRPRPPPPSARHLGVAPLVVRSVPAAQAVQRRSARCYAGSWEDAYKGIREQRAAKKKTREAAQRADEGGGQEAGAGVRGAAGDTVELRYEVTDVSSGKVVDSSAISASGNERLLRLQLGTDAGFEPKSGLRLAYNDVCMGLCVGEAAEVVVQASGKGLFRSYDIFLGEERIGSLNQDEKRLEWATKPSRVTVEVVSITPPRGRGAGQGRRAYKDQLPNTPKGGGGGGGPIQMG